MNRLGLAALLVVVSGSLISAEEKADEKAIPKTIGKIERLDPAFDKLVPSTASIEVLGSGYDWSEGVVWIPKGGYALFSDIPPNKIMKWTPGKEVTLFKERVGYTGKEPFKGTEPGTNGLMLDAQGRLWMCCHGDRCIKRMEPDGTFKTIVDKFEGKRLNSPNDLVFHSNGDLYFTDPPYGLPEREKDKGRELDWFGVYRLDTKGKLSLVTKEMTRPNGIGFSPDEKTLYVAQSDPEAALWKAFPVKDDGSLGDSKVLFDATAWVKKGEKGLPDGFDVDSQGNLWATGPGGVSVITPEGKLLGRLNTGEATANCKFGLEGDTLLVCADMYFCKVQTSGGKREQGKGNRKSKTLHFVGCMSGAKYTKLCAEFKSGVFRSAHTPYLFNSEETVWPRMPDVSAAIVLLSGVLLMLCSAVGSSLTGDSRKRLAGWGWVLVTVGIVAWLLAYIVLFGAMYSNQSVNR